METVGLPSWEIFMIQAKTPGSLGDVITQPKNVFNFEARMTKRLNQDNSFLFSFRTIDASNMDTYFTKK